MEHSIYQFFKLLERMKKSGVTLIEIIIVMGLMALVTLAVVTNYSGSTRRQTVVGAAEEIRTAFFQARANAASGRKDCGTCGAAGGVCGTGDSPLQGWEVNVSTTTNPVAYTVRGVCSPLPYPTGVPTPFLTKSESLPTGVTVTVAGGVMPVLFRPVGGGLYPPLPAAGAMTLTFSDAYGNSSTVSVNGAGEVR